MISSQWQCTHSRLPTRAAAALRHEVACVSPFPSGRFLFPSSPLLAAPGHSSGVSFILRSTRQSNDLPVITGGTGTPMYVRIVGAMSARPPSERLKAVVEQSGSIATNGTLVVEWAV